MESKPLVSISMPASFHFIAVVVSSEQKAHGDTQFTVVPHLMSQFPLTAFSDDSCFMASFMAAVVFEEEFMVAAIFED